MRMLLGASILAVFLVFPACSKSPSAAVSQPAASTSQGASAAASLRYQTPDGWVTEKPSTTMRLAQFALPKAEGDPEDANAVIYYFGEGQGGGVQENLDRWVGQMQQPDGSSSKDKAKTESITVNGLKVTTLDVSGTYSAGAMAGGALNPHGEAGLSRMLAAVIETPKGAYFLKLIGPVRTVGRWNQSFHDFVKSVEFK